MARLMKGPGNRYMIEVQKARKWVVCIVRGIGSPTEGKYLTRVKRYPLVKLINEPGGEYDQFYHEIFKEVPEAEYSLKKAVNHFLNPRSDSGFLVTERARNLLQAILEDKQIEEHEMQEDDKDVKPSVETSTQQPETPAGEATVKKSKSKSKGGKKAVKAKSERKGLEDRKIKMLSKTASEKSFHEGSLRGKCFAVIKEHGNGGMTVADYVSTCQKKHINRAQALGCLAKLADKKGQKFPTVEIV